jgi:hypothetical protein
MRQQYFIILLFIPLSFSVVYADSNEVSDLDHRNKVEKLCEKDPLHQKCKKFLDGKYRRHNDAERSEKRNKQDIFHKDDRTYEKEVKNELITFCRNEPDAPRCSKVRNQAQR